MENGLGLDAVDAALVPKVGTLNAGALASPDEV